MLLILPEYDKSRNHYSSALLFVSNLPINVLESACQAFTETES